VKYLTKEQVLLVHSMIIDETGGLHGVRDYHALLYLEDAPQQSVFGKELYPTVFLKAAVYTYNIIMSHPFLDGNKRTGITAAGIFMEKNGYTVIAKEGEIEKFALRIVVRKLSIEEIAQWFEKHSKKL